MKVIESIRNGSFKNIVVLTGAGVSTNAGIPDYKTLRQYEDLVSDIEKYAFLEPKIKVAQPTKAHKLCKWFDDKGWLLRVYTQNIDSLHQGAGLSDDKVVEFHGSLKKNNVVTYGSCIQTSVTQRVVDDLVNNMQPIDLLLVMGTSLQCAPFCALPNLVPKECTRVLVDIVPENVMKNAWSKSKRSCDSIYETRASLRSDIKFGNRKASLRPQWGKDSKWKSQYLIQEDCDRWAEELMKE